MKITLRPAATADLPEILSIVNHAIANTTAIYDYEPRTLEMQRQIFEEKARSGFPLIVAELEEKIAGFGTYGTFKPKTGYRFTAEHSVYVRSDLTGKGIGKLLLARLIELAKEQKLHTLIGVIDTSNTGSIAFHKQFGFVENGTIRQAGFKFGKWLDVTMMQLILE